MARKRGPLNRRLVCWISGGWNLLDLDTGGNADTYGLLAREGGVLVQPEAVSSLQEPGGQWEGGGRVSHGVLLLLFCASFLESGPHLRETSTWSQGSWLRYIFALGVQLDSIEVEGLVFPRWWWGSSCHTHCKPPPSAACTFPCTAQVSCNCVLVNDKHERTLRQTEWLL